MAKKPIVPEARMALTQFRAEIANELGINRMNQSFSGDLTSRQAGQMGGQLGGEMTKRLIENASNSMVYENDALPPNVD